MHEPYVLSATTKHTATFIFLHGLGDTGKGWCSTFELIREPHVKYVFPNAPIKPVTLNAGMQMPAWFDIYGLTENVKTDEHGLKMSTQIIHRLIDQEISAGINRVAIGGFSQGGALALYSALTHPRKPLRGVLALSSWLVLYKEIQKINFSSDQLEMPILMCHGDDDNIVPLKSGRDSSEFLKSKGFKNTEFKIFADIGHGSNDAEISYVKQFMDKLLA
ncbi:hypothetical protein ACOME3_008545 [Neoechinorhynchus agilis]